jgi:hypothetical protein
VSSDECDLLTGGFCWHDFLTETQAGLPESRTGSTCLILARCSEKLQKQNHRFVAQDTASVHKGSRSPIPLDPRGPLLLETLTGRGLNPSPFSNAILFWSGAEHRRNMTRLASNCRAKVNTVRFLKCKKKPPCKGFPAKGVPSTRRLYPTCDYGLARGR